MQQSSDAKQTGSSAMSNIFIDLVQQEFVSIYLFNFFFQYLCFFTSIMAKFNIILFFKLITSSQKPTNTDFSKVNIAVFCTQQWDKAESFEKLNQNQILILGKIAVYKAAHTCKIFCCAAKYVVTLKIKKANLSALVPNVT